MFAMKPWLERQKNGRNIGSFEQIKAEMRAEREQLVQSLFEELNYMNNK